MANFFYFDRNAQKQGPVSQERLKELAARGVIDQNTPMETDTGHKGRAGQIPGLFAAGSTPFAPPAQVAPPPASRQLFCTNCGAPSVEQAVTCMSCGARPVGYTNFCRQCGTALHPGQLLCIKCGVAVQSVSAAVQITGAPCDKNRVTAGILAILIGGIGIHKFYMGSWGWGIVYVMFFWTYVPAILGLIEGIMYLAMSDDVFAAKYPSNTKAPFRW
jgi:TM2 domain-containing membrane protein YozV